MRYGMFLCFLLLAAAQDWRHKAVEAWIFVCFGTIAVILDLGGCLFQIEWMKTTDLGPSWIVPLDGINLLAGGALGILLIALGRLCRGAIGLGDGLFFLVSGLYLGFWDNLLLLFLGTFLCGSFGLCLFTWNQLRYGKARRGQSLPFLPFVTVAGIGILGGRWYYGI